MSGWPPCSASGGGQPGLRPAQRDRGVEEGFAVALSPYRRGGRVYDTKLDGEQEAHLIALACSTPPDGHGCWTLRLLAWRMVELAHVDTLSHETVRQTLKKTRSSRT